MSDWRPGEPITSRKLNAHSASRAQVDVSGPPGSFSKFGQHWASTQADLTNTGMWVRVTSAPVVASAVVTGGITQDVSLHSWEAIYWNDGLKKWQANRAAYGNASVTNNTTSDYDAIIAPDLGNLTRTTDASLTSNTTAQSGVTPYFAVRDPVSRRLIAVNPSGGGNFNATSTETVIMILGTYDDYKDCPNVPPKPPTAITDFCNGTRGTDLCVPAYAYAVYQRCGYVWNKIGDTRTYQVWANELNGGSAGNRRFHIPRWGGNLTAAGPDPDSACMGLAFLNSGAGSLTCGCPPCLSSPPPGSTLCARFRTMPRPVALPANPSGCVDLRVYMDTNDLWDKEITIPFSVIGCPSGGADDLFDLDMQHIDGPDLECDWGPDVFDPCEPCAHWSRMQASIGVSQSGPGSNCGGSGQWSGEFLTKDICKLLCDCDSGPVRPVATKVCNNCGTTPNCWHVIKEDSVELICCPTDSILGGDAFSSPSSGYSGGNSTTSYDAFYGGEA